MCINKLCKYIAESHGFPMTQASKFVMHESNSARCVLISRHFRENLLYACVVY